MKLTMSLPSDLERAKRDNLPVLIAGGTVEYHGSHCAYGCDGIIAERMIEKLSETRDLLIAPTVWYSPASYAVAGRASGTVHIEEDAFENYCYYIFRSLLYAGLKNIYVLIHHQYENENLMPMTLCYMKAAKKAIMRYLEETAGEGWWGSEKSKDYYAQLDGGNPFDWIQVLPCMSARAQKTTGYDHAGLYETSLLSALEPDAVRLDKLNETAHWYTESAKDSSAALGETMLRISLADLNERIR